jgi:hypothetical protein
LCQKTVRSLRRSADLERDGHLTSSSDRGCASTAHPSRPVMRRRLSGAGGPRGKMPRVTIHRLRRCGAMVYKDGPLVRRPGVLSELTTVRGQISTLLGYAVDQLLRTPPPIEPSRFSRHSGDVFVSGRIPLLHDGQRHRQLATNNPRCALPFTTPACRKSAGMWRVFRA